MKLMHRTGARSFHAFTLIELLVVVAIIALLISILLPSLSRAREQAKQLQCLSNLRSMGQGIALYVNNNRSFLPGPLHPPIFRETGHDVVADPDDPWDPMNPETELPWFLLARLGPVFGTEETALDYVDQVGTCPTAFGLNPDDNFKPNINGNHQDMRPYHYLPNTWPNTDPGYYFGWVNIGSTWKGWELEYRSGESNYDAPKKIETIKRPADEWAIGDAWWDLRRAMITPGNFRDTFLGTWQISAGAGPNDPTGGSHNPLPRTPIHQNRRATNLVFFDGHGEPFIGIEEWALEFPANRSEDYFPQQP